MIDQPARVTSLRRLAGTTLATNIAVAAFSFITVIVVGRALGPEGRGDLAAFQLISSICALIFALGLPHAATYFAAIQPSSARRVVRSTAGIASVLGLLGAAVAAAGTWIYLSDDQTPGLQTAGLVYALTVVLLPVLGVLIHPLRSVNKIRSWNRLRFLLDSSMIGVAIVVLFGVRSFVSIATVQVTWLAVLTVVAASRWRGRTESIDAGHVGRRALVGFGVPTMLATLPYFLNFRVDQLFIKAVDGSQELGYYATAVTWSAASLPVISTITMLALPRLAGRTVDRDASAARFVRSSIALAAVTAFALAVTAPVAIVLLFGPAFSKSSVLAIPLSFITALLGVTSTAEEVLRAYGDVRYPARAQLTGLALNVVLLAVLIPLLGSWGAVIASGVAYLIVCVAVVERVRILAKLNRRSMIPSVADSRMLWNLARHRRILPDADSLAAEDTAEHIDATDT